MWTTNFWKQATERAVKTFAQALIAVLTVDGIGVLDVDWQAAGSVAALAAIVSVLTSIVTSQIGEPGDPSIVQRNTTT